MQKISNLIKDIKNTINPKSILDNLNIEVIAPDIDKIIYKSNNSRFEILISESGITLFVWHFTSIENEKFIIECNNGKHFIYVENNKYKKYYNYKMI